MQFDRQITITTGASRNDLNWKPQLMTVAELYDRLRNPVRSTETLDAWAAFRMVPRGISKYR